MRIRWRNLELPTKVVADSATRTDTYAKFTAEPFERGYGVTVGNGLRRVLLSSIEGSAVTSVKIQGVKHEFSSLEGIKEDVTDIILALKRLCVQFHTDDPKVLRIEKQGQGPVTAADIQTSADADIVNKDLYICNITTDRSFEAEIEVRKGRGYVTAEENAREEQEIGVIPIDSIFSPIQRVRYRTGATGNAMGRRAPQLLRRQGERGLGGAIGEVDCQHHGDAHHDADEREQCLPAMPELVAQAGAQQCGREPSLHASVNRPCCNSRTRSAASATAGLCVTITRVVSWTRASAVSSSITFLPLVSSRLPVGSSARSSFGRCASALATAVRCCSPPERVSG